MKEWNVIQIEEASPKMFIFLLYGICVKALLFKLFEVKIQGSSFNGSCTICETKLLNVMYTLDHLELL